LPCSEGSRRRSSPLKAEGTINSFAESFPVLRLLQNEGSRLTSAVIVPPMSTSIPAVELHTRRLLLRPLQLSDAQQTQLLFPHWQIVQHLNPNVPWPYPADGALTYYRDVALPAIERGDEWQWTLRLKQSPEHHIGAISLHKAKPDNRGFWLGLPWHNQGLMTEAVIAVNDFWFDVLGFPVLRAPKAVGNLASRRISEKTGMRIVATEERHFVSGRHPCEIWEITAEEWHQARALLQPYPEH
jgi:[ribosomal protein S5]-alanine N-acetyltransferase